MSILVYINNLTFLEIFFIAEKRSVAKYSHNEIPTNRIIKTGFN